MTELKEKTTGRVYNLKGKLLYKKDCQKSEQCVNTNYWSSVLKDNKLQQTVKQIALNIPCTLHKRIIENLQKNIEYR